jgi:hypothetical protein
LVQSPFVYVRRFEAELAGVVALRRSVQELDSSRPVASGDPSVLVAMSSPSTVVMDVDWKFTQYTGRGVYGSNACLQVAGNIAAQTLLSDDVVAELWVHGGGPMRTLVQESVKAWDERASTRALEPIAFLRSFLSDVIGHRLRIWEVVLEARLDWKFVGLICSSPSPAAFILTVQADKVLLPHSACLRPTYRLTLIANRCICPLCCHLLGANTEFLFLDLIGANTEFVLLTLERALIFLHLTSEMHRGFLVGPGR